MKITLLYQVSRYIRVKKQRDIKSWDQQNDLVVITGFSYIRPLYNEVPLYRIRISSCTSPTSLTSNQARKKKKKKNSPPPPIQIEPP